MDPKDIQFIAHPIPGNPPDPGLRRLARVHAMNVATRRERSLRNQKLENFRPWKPTHTESHTLGKNQASVGPAWNPSPSVDIEQINMEQFGPQQDEDAISLTQEVQRLSFQPSSLDLSRPLTNQNFEGIPISASRVNTLMRSYAFTQAVEPLFSPDHTDFHHNISATFPTGLKDPSFLCALLYSIASFQNQDTTTREELMLKGEAIRTLNHQISSSSPSISDACIGTVLILTGVEYRTGAPQAHEAHMQGLLQMLRLGGLANLSFSSKVLIERVLFWQDLNAAVMTGSQRVFDHNTFPHMRWVHSPPRDLSVFSLPDGFTKSVHCFPDALLTALEDIGALQRTVYASYTNNDRWASFGDIGNIQASIESRLQMMVEETQMRSVVAESCRIAAHICCYVIFTATWNARTIPLHLARQLHTVVASCVTNPGICNNHYRLILWVLFVGMGASFGEDLDLRYLGLILDHLRRASISEQNTFGDREGVHKILETFLWSDTWFGRPWSAIWDSVQSAGITKIFDVQ